MSDVQKDCKLLPGPVRETLLDQALYASVENRMKIEDEAQKRAEKSDRDVQRIGDELRRVINERDKLSEKLKITVDALNFIATTDEKDVASCFNRGIAIQALQRLK